MSFWKRRKKNLKVVVTGNCQARPIAKIVETLSSSIEVTAVGIVHLLKNAEREKYLIEFNKADYIFAQRVDNKYPCEFVRTEFLRNNWGGKVVVWPNLYYRGYNPELIYLRLNNHSPLRGPLGDYHNQTIIESWKKGLSVKETLSRHKDIEYNRERYGNIPDISLAELKEREKDCDIKIVQYLENIISRERQFFTFNHPKNELLVYAAKKILDVAGLQQDGICSQSHQEPLGQFYPPTNAYIADKYALSLGEVKGWKGVRVTEIEENVVNTGESKVYEDDEIIDIYYKIYDANKSLLSDGS
jgi:hypothetical protein